MNCHRRRLFVAVVFLFTALVCLRYLFYRIREGSDSEWDFNITPKPECRIDYSPPESFGRLSPAWKLRPGFVHFADRCLDDLHIKSKADSSYLIPRIIHQVWDSNNVPELYINWTRSWLSVNPGWQHWFWTFSDVRDLVSRHYPDQLKTWDSYPTSIFRADAMRYFVVHRYGGVYVDLDYEAVRPLDMWAQRYRCLFSEEPYEHVFLLHRKATTFVSSAFIACSPRHPLLLAAIHRLDSASQQFGNNVMYATGPFMINSVLETYVKNQSSRQSRTQQCVEASVTIVPPFYFQPVFAQPGNVWKICNGTMGKPSVSKEISTVCSELRRSNFTNKVNPMAYAVHWWFLAWMKDSWKKSTRVNMTESVVGIRPAGQWAVNYETKFKPVNWCAQSS